MEEGVITKSKDENDDMQYYRRSRKTKGIVDNIQARLGESSPQYTYPFTFSACLIVKDDNQILPE